MTKLKSFWIEQPLISTWNKCAFSINVHGQTVNNSTVYVTPKRNMVIFMVISDIWSFWDDLLTIVSVLHMKWNPSHYGSFMLALMSCSLCNMTVNSIIEGKGSHWETLQWLGDVNRKLIVADECRRSHRKFRLPGVLDGWVSLPYLLFLTRSFFSVSILKRYCEVEREGHKAFFVAPYVHWRTTEREPLNERPGSRAGQYSFTNISMFYSLLW